MTWRTAPALSVLMLTALLFAMRAITVPIGAESGLGDSTQYTKLVVGLRTGEPTAPEAPFAYRILPAAIVAASGLDPWLGFFALNIAAILGTGLLILVLLRRHSSPAGAVLAVVGWGLLPYVLRFTVRDALLTDAMGTFFLSAAFAAAVARRVLLFPVLLVAGVLTRESVIVVAPLMLLRVQGEGPRQILKAIVVAVPAVLALLLVHLAPPVAPVIGSATTADYVGYRAYAILNNIDGATWRLLASPLFGIGALVGPLVSLSALRVVRSEPGWLYALVAGGVLAIIGGGDHDRYLCALAPILVVVAVRSLPSAQHTTVMSVLLALQLVAARLLMPLNGRTAPGFQVSSMPFDVLTGWSAAILVCASLAAITASRLRRAAPSNGRVLAAL